MRKLRELFAAAGMFSFLLLTACQQTPVNAPAPETAEAPTDLHSYASPQLVRVTNVDLDWTVSFEKKTLAGTAVLTIERSEKGKGAPLVLDTRDLKIEKAEGSSDGGNTWAEAKFELAKPDDILGSELKVFLSPDAKLVKIAYETSPSASGLQWLAPEQTAGKEKPYMFSQAQAIHARSFIPLQDSPGVRVTYSAKVKTPEGLLAVMSAENNPQGEERPGEYSFKMSKAVPPYLIAIAVGDIAFKPLGERTGVYTEPSMMEKAANELEDTEKMISATEKLYGQYRWGRYDLLILPPSFPFGGMENPVLTFATPTILAGDKSLVSLVAHELAHSWSGNLVTNSTWRDFWLNEGFTTYLEWRIQEAVYGKDRADMEMVLAKKGLEEEMKEMEERDEILHVDLKDRDPDEGFTGVPYTKGALFLRHLELAVGREDFDNFLKSYFEHFAFKSITTEQFKEYARENLVDKFPDKVAMDDLNKWIDQPGLPPNAPQPESEAFKKVDEQLKSWTEGTTKASDLQTQGWTTQEWLHFLGGIPPEVGTEKMAELDEAFGLTSAGNSEIAFKWLMMAVHNKYEPAYPRLEEFLTAIGRRKFVAPLFEELAKTPEGKQRAEGIYEKSRAGYHPITAGSVDKILGK
ncbi:MAG: M1 family metallopeptidase [Acidobacteriota bacterium]|nr:MAG: M1 family metallopeptidase [Acidobacteriota bacterium]